MATLLDRNVTGLENVASILLAVGVGLTAAMIINIGHYTDLCMFLFCAVTASCQYSLLKSVQPDSASPTHGFNRIIVYRYVLVRVTSLEQLSLAEFSGE